MAEEPTVSLQSDGLQPGHDIFCTPNNDAFHASSLYSELDVAQQEIRLIELWPGNGDDAIECTLLPGAPLRDLNGRYTAPSYCAGSAKNTEPIVLNGTTFNVFANLAHALREVRQFWSTTYGDRECLLWVDQISINQYDINERSSQVRFMREIYQYAEQVLVCLSTKNDDPRGMLWLIQLARDLGTYTTWQDESFASRARGAHDSALKSYISHNSGSEEFLEGCRASYNVLGAPWFTRAWVFQEFIVAAKVQFMYSGVHASWETIRPALKAICKGRSYLDVVETPHKRRSLSFRVWRSLNAPLNRVALATESKSNWCGEMDLKKLLRHSRACDASDPRDKVFAYIGLTDPAYGILPNYSHSINQVLIDTTERIIKTENSLEVLEHAIDSAPPLDPSLPSWVVDWRRNCVYARDDDHLRSHHPGLEKVQANVSFHEPETFSDFPRALQVDGIFVNRRLNFIGKQNQSYIMRSTLTRF